MIRILSLLAALLLATPSLAHETQAGTLQIIHAHILPPPKGAKTAGGYLAIANGGAEADRLIGISCDFAEMAMLHESRIDENGVGTMRHVEALDIPAGQTVTLDHGGYHIMFMGLTESLAEGAMFKATLHFEQAGPVEVEFSVDAGEDHAAD